MPNTVIRGEAVLNRGLCRPTALRTAPDRRSVSPGRCARLFACVFGVLGLLSLAPTQAQTPGVNVPAGASLNLAGGSLRGGCIDVLVGGQLSAGSGSAAVLRTLRIDAGGRLQAGSATLRLGGDLINAGQFEAGSSRFEFIDDCAAAARIEGITGFHWLSIASSTGKRFELEGGRILDITGGLTVQGVPGQNARLVSDSAETALIRLGPGATASVSNADLPAGNVRILGGTALPEPRVVPAGGAGSLAFLILAVLAMTALRLRRA